MCSLDLISLEVKQRALLLVNGDALPFVLVERAAQDRTVKGYQGIPQLGLRQRLNMQLIEPQLTETSGRAKALRVQPQRLKVASRMSF